MTENNITDTIDLLDAGLRETSQALQDLAFSWREVSKSDQAAPLTTIKKTWMAVQERLRDVAEIKRELKSMSEKIENLETRLNGVTP
jgi:hypothetical protein